MWDLDLYARLDLADAWAIIGPINWYAPSSSLKLMFDRLVCMSGGNPREDLINHKDPEKAMALEHPPDWEALSLNHLEGRTAEFFCYGDGGADELDTDDRPRVLQHKQYFDPDQEPFEDERDAYAPLVWQSRYSGIEVPDQLWQYGSIGEGKKYSDSQAEDIASEPNFYQKFDAWTEAFTDFVNQKGKVPSNLYRAYGHETPGHVLADLQLLWRNARLQVGIPPKGSSPAEQQAAGLNQDVTLTMKKGEGEKLREHH